MAQHERQTLFALEDEDGGAFDRGESSRGRSMSASSGLRLQRPNDDLAGGAAEDTQALLGSSRRGSAISKTADEDERYMGPADEEVVVRVATKEQKAALWWRNFFITGIFVLSWRVA